MIIGVDIRALLESQLTGIGNYTLELLKHLLNLDHQSQYKLFNNSLKHPSQELMSFLKPLQNVKLYSFRYPSKLLNASLTFIKRPFLDRLIGGADLFWFPNFNFWQVSDQCRTVITVHDLSFKRIPWVYSQKMRRWHKFVNPQEKLRQADKIIVVSENTRKDLMEIYNLPSEKIEVIYPGVNLRPKTALASLRPPAVRQWRRQCRAGQQGRPGTEDRISIRPREQLPNNFILFLGTLEPRKNVEGVIQAFEKVSQEDLHLVIAGGKGWLYKKIYRLFCQSSVKDRIIFLDYVKPEERWQLYEKAQALIWPSFYEGFGFPPLEAMSVGCPVITSVNSSLPEVVGEAALLVDPYNIQEIAAAINQLLIDEKLRQNLISKGYEQVKKYSWENSAQKMLEAFKSLVY